MHDHQNGNLGSTETGCLSPFLRRVRGPEGSPDFLFSYSLYVMFFFQVAFLGFLV
jgi:hypothetical protein